MAPSWRASTLKASSLPPLAATSSISALALPASRRATQTCNPPAAKRRATAAPMASPAPTSRATGLLAVMCAPSFCDELCGPF